METSPYRKPLALCAWLLLCFAAAATGAFTSIGAWYAGIRKPEWNPPAWVFGPVWTVLYCMMAVAAWMVWCDGGWKKQMKPLSLFCVQLALNALWTPLFFGMHRPDLALLDILAMWVAIVLTLLAFWRVKARAGMLLIPYLAWVSFATFLNFTLWRLNP
ncbi:MAG: TspO/MBR family protein [Planctomycetota bacterium]